MHTQKKRPGAGTPAYLLLTTQHLGTQCVCDRVTTQNPTRTPEERAWSVVPLEHGRPWSPLVALGHALRRQDP